MSGALQLTTQRILLSYRTLVAVDQIDMTQTCIINRPIAIQPILLFFKIKIANIFSSRRFKESRLNVGDCFIGPAN